MRELIIDPEFRDKIPPLSADEFSKLEENILADGEVREPLVCWHNTIVDGHHRWKIIQKHPEIPYKVEQKEFANKWAAIAWMCKNQLGRRNLTDEQKSYLRGKQYEAEKMSVGAQEGNTNASKNETDKMSTSFSRREQRDGTAGRIGKEYGVDGRTIRRDADYAGGLDDAEKASPGIRQAVLSGEVKVPKQVIAGIRKLPEDERPAAVEAIKRGELKEAQRLTQPDKPYVPTPIATPVEPRPPYNLDDFEEELEYVVKNMDGSFKLTLVMAHREMLNTAEGRDRARSVLQSGRRVIEKYENMIKEVELNG